MDATSDQLIGESTAIYLRDPESESCLTHIDIVKVALEAVKGSFDSVILELDPLKSA